MFLTHAKRFQHQLVHFDFDVYDDSGHLVANEELFTY